MNIAPRDNAQETARRGQEWYQQTVLPQLEAAHNGAFVAIDIESGAYALDKDDYAATEKLLARQPNAQIWLMRVGRPATRRMGGARLAAKQGTE